MAFVEYKGVFASAEGASQDFLWLGHGRPVDVSQQVVLEIDDLAYAQLFHSASPVSPRILTSLVQQISSAEPAVLGVDVLTVSEADGGDSYRNFAAQTGDTKVVWMAGAAGFASQPANFFSWLCGREDVLVIEPTEVLGRNLQALNTKPEILWGPAVYPSDQDSKLRRFSRELDLSKTPAKIESSQPRQSWAKCVAQQYCRTYPGRCKHLTGKEIYLNAAGPRPNSVGLTEYFTRTGDHVEFRPNRKQFLTQILKGKIALLGGTFSSSGDFHETSEGDHVPGIFVNARAIAAEIHGIGIHEVPQPLSVILDITFGALTIVTLTALDVGFGIKAHSARSMMLGSAISVLIITAFSFWLGSMFSVVAVLVAAAVQQFIDFWRANPRESHFE